MTIVTISFSRRARTTHDYPSLQFLAFKSSKLHDKKSIRPKYNIAQSMTARSADEYFAMDISNAENCTKCQKWFWCTCKKHIVIKKLSFSSQPKTVFVNVLHKSINLE